MAPRDETTTPATDTHLSPRTRFLLLPVYAIVGWGAVGAVAVAAMRLAGAAH